MIEKKENLPLLVVISLMDLSIYLYLLAYLKSNKPVYFLFQSYCSFLDTHVNFLPVMYEELCDEHLVRSLRYNMQPTLPANSFFFQKIVVLFNHVNAICIDISSYQYLDTHTHAPHAPVYNYNQFLLLNEQTYHPISKLQSYLTTSMLYVQIYPHINIWIYVHMHFTYLYITTINFFS